MPYRTTAFDLSVDGEFVWVATGYGVQLLEGTRVVGSIAVPGLTRVVRATGNGFAYAGSGARVYALRREGRALVVVGSTAASGDVNAFEVVGNQLFAGTTNGIDHYDLLDPASPAKKNTVLTTSSRNVTSLAASRTLLYAADGDSTVELFSITTPSAPQPIGAMDAMPRASALHFNADRLYVSDLFGQATEVYNGASRITRLPVGATSLAPLTDRIHFVAGPDRTVRAVDFSTGSRAAEYLELQLPPTDGTDNAVHALARSGNTLYVAAGDIGVVTIDVTSFTRPFPLVNYLTDSVSSIRAFGDRAWVADVAGNFLELRVDLNGLALNEERKWTGTPGSIIHDVRDNAMVTAVGRDLTFWALTSIPPTTVMTAKLVTDVVAAVSADSYLVALLANGSVYTTPKGQAAPQKVNLPPMALLTRAGSAIVMAEIREAEGKTVLHYWPTGDLASAARQFTVDGAAVGTLALDATRAAVFTFNGISVVDLAGGAVRVIRGSNSILPRQLAFAGNDLLALDGRRLLVFGNAETLVREQALPAETLAFDIAGPVAVLATVEGFGAVSRTRALPEAVARFSSSYFTKVVAAGDRVYLLQKTGIDVLSSTAGSSLHYVAGITARGAIDLAASESGLYTLSANGTVSWWSRAGSLLGQRVLNEGADMQPLAIATAGGAVWVSLSTGCSSGACERKTLVLDPSTLAVTATLAGALRDVVVSGTRAYALFDAPNELRVLDVSSPLQPAQLGAVERPASATSLAYEGGRIHVLGDKLYTYSESGLGLIAERFAAVVPEASQRIRIADGCAVVTGRSPNPELFSAPDLVAANGFEVPAGVRSIATLPGRLFLLTTHSLEVWSTQPADTTRTKRRSAR